MPRVKKTDRKYTMTEKALAGRKLANQKMVALIKKAKMMQADEPVVEQEQEIYDDQDEIVNMSNSKQEPEESELDNDNSYEAIIQQLASKLNMLEEKQSLHDQEREAYKIEKEEMKKVKEGKQKERLSKKEEREKRKREKEEVLLELKNDYISRTLRKRNIDGLIDSSKKSILASACRF